MQELQVWQGAGSAVYRVLLHLVAVQVEGFAHHEVEGVVPVDGAAHQGVVLHELVLRYLGNSNRNPGDIHLGDNTQDDPVD